MEHAQFYLQLISPAAIGALFLWMRGIKQDIRDTKKDVQDLKNGCFTRHANIERELGRIEEHNKIYNTKIL